MDDSHDTSREEAIASLKRKQKFWTDALLYLAVNGALWLIWLIADRTTDGSIPWPAWVSMAWGFFLGLDAFKAFGPWPARAIDEAAIERERRRLAPH